MWCFNFAARRWFICKKRTRFQSINFWLRHSQNSSAEWMFSLSLCAPFLWFSCTIAFHERQYMLVNLCLRKDVIVTIMFLSHWQQFSCRLGNCKFSISVYWYWLIDWFSEEQACEWVIFRSTYLLRIASWDILIKC